jgi:glycosyltransferase involved in cell wall biosynthesis
MRILFVHQNFPGQFKHLAPTLAKNPKHRVYAFTMQKKAPSTWQGVRLVSYQAERGTSSTVHRWVSDLETKVIRGEAAFKAALQLRTEGFRPDVIVAHPGWGESLFLKEVWPEARLAIYCEFFTVLMELMWGLIPNFRRRIQGIGVDLNSKMSITCCILRIADAGISPREWQASTFPEAFRRKISVIHDGIDTDSIKPNPDVTLTLNQNLQLSQQDELITFVNRNLEPYRGYHIFMRGLSRKFWLCRPKARILIVGGNDVSYGARPRRRNLEGQVSGRST